MQPMERQGTATKIKRLPLWAKIAVPLGALIIVGNISNALKPEPKTIAARQVAPLDSTAIEAVATDSATTTAITTTATTTTGAETTTTAKLTNTTAKTVPHTVAFVSPTAAPTPPPASGLDPQYGTCKEAKAHGLGPYYQASDPEYYWYRDADHDGIVCE